MPRGTVHFAEFKNLCIACVRLSLAKKDRARVTAWLQTWEMVDPESPSYQEWRKIAAHSSRTRSNERD